MQCNAMQCNAMQCNAMQCNAMQRNAMQCNAMQCNAMQCNVMQCNAMQCFSLISAWCRVRTQPTASPLWMTSKLKLCCIFTFFISGLIFSKFASLSWSTCDTWPLPGVEYVSRVSPLWMTNKLTLSAFTHRLLLYNFYLGFDLFGLFLFSALFNTKLLFSFKTWLLST